MFDRFSKHLEVYENYSAAHHVFYSLLGLWDCGQAPLFLFDILYLLTSYWVNG